MSIQTALVYLGESPQARAIENLIPKLARTRVPVLLLGESGTGKDVVARAIHQANPRGQFVPIDCTALAGGLFESELFGHVRGAFTGAVAAKPGLIELADGGTAFFDEIGDVSLEFQVKLLRLMQGKEYRPVGSPLMRTADFRVIAATNRELAEMVERNEFRRDLYYRLKVITVRIPPLRERKQDIEPLTLRFLASCGPQFRLAPGVLSQLLAYDWPGNVRELQYCVEAMTAMSSSPELEECLLPSAIAGLRERPGSRFDDPDSAPAGQRWRSRQVSAILPLEEIEKQAIARALEYTGWDRAAAARMLHIGRTTLYRKIKEHGLMRAAAKAAGAGS